MLKNYKNIKIYIYYSIYYTHMQNIDEKIIISIEGNIGVGKSTFVEKVLKANWENCEIVPEPIDLWNQITDPEGKNILHTFYSDIKRWAYSFQNVACITRMMKMDETIRNSDNKYIFLDRSLATDANVFEKMLYDSKNINEQEHKMYLLWYDFYWKYVRDRNTNKSIHIYLKCDAEVCLDRIKKRGREEEKGITLDYLNDLNKYHDAWLTSDNECAIVIDCNEDFEHNPERQSQMIQTIRNRLDQIMNTNQNNKINITKHIEIEHETNESNEDI